jgi:hypothetical protein
MSLIVLLGSEVTTMQGIGLVKVEVIAMYDAFWKDHKSIGSTLLVSKHSPELKKQANFAPLTFYATGLSSQSKTSHSLSLPKWVTKLGKFNQFEVKIPEITTKIARHSNHFLYRAGTYRLHHTQNVPRSVALMS